jgi:hypothetical protein
VKDYLIPHVTGKTMGSDMFDALVTVYHSVNINWKMMLHAYLIKIIELCDQLATIGEESRVKS